MKTYSIKRRAEGVEVLIDGKDETTRLLNSSLEVKIYSIHGFDYGNTYVESAQLALAILLDCTKNADVSQFNCDDFTRQVIADIKTNEHTITERFILDWIGKKPGLWA